MNLTGNSGSIEDVLPALPTHVVRRFQAPSQLDFEIGFYQGVIDRDPAYVEVLRVLGNNLSAKGEKLRAFEIDRKLTALTPDDPLAHYNLACSFSQLERIDEAIRALARSIELGYDEFDYMDEDQDLDAVRKDPRYRALLDKAGRRHQSAQDEQTGVES